jgi:hypothetical protein
MIPFDHQTKGMPSRGKTVTGRLVAAGLSAVLSSAAVACRAPSPAPAAAAIKLPPPSRDEIRRELEAIAQKIRAGHNIFFGEAPLTELPQALADKALPPERRVNRLGQYALALLRAGRVKEAIDALTEARELTVKQKMDPRIRLQVLQDLAVAEMRLGEQANCLEHHVAASCLMPITKAGVHRDPTGSRAAMRYLEEYLAESPDAPTARWLLNVAAMTVGRYPDGVPKKFRIDPATMPPIDEAKQFRDVAHDVGLDIVDSAGAGIMDDFDGDGFLDILTTTMNPAGGGHFFHNDGHGHFVDQTKGSGLDVQLGSLNAVHADYDNDGDFDVLILRGGWLSSDGNQRKSLLQNDGHGVFTDVTAQAGLASPSCPTQAADWADYDNDGHLDLYVGCEVDDNKQPYPSQLWHNNGDGTFTEVAAEAGVQNMRMAKGVAWGDYDEDGYPDLYVSNIGGNRLYHNDHNGHFHDVAPELGVEQPMVRNFATWFFDYDNDGHDDIFVADYSASMDAVVGRYVGLPSTAGGGHPRLYRNLGNGHFQDVSEKVGLDQPSLPMGANFGDIDNDGYLDIYLGTGTPVYQALMPNLMYRNVGGQRFEDVSFAWGFAHLQKGHGVAFGDFDDDGNQDVFEQMGGAFVGDAYHSVLYKNPGHGGSWVTLRLAGTRSNRNAIGARITVNLQTPHGPRVLHRTVGASGSFGGSSYQQEIGLGDAQHVDSIVVSWPTSHTSQTFRDVAPNARYDIREGDPSGQ